MLTDQHRLELENFLKSPAGRAVRELVDQKHPVHRSPDFSVLAPGAPNPCDSKILGLIGGYELVVKLIFTELLARPEKQEQQPNSQPEPGQDW